MAVRGWLAKNATGSIRLAAISGDELQAVQSLIFPYRDQPMDFADASVSRCARIHFRDFNSRSK
jgi:hypothetical protein